MDVPALGVFDEDAALEVEDPDSDPVLDEDVVADEDSVAAEVD